MSSDPRFNKALTCPAKPLIYKDLLALVKWTRARGGQLFLPHKKSFCAKIIGGAGVKKRDPAPNIHLSDICQNPLSRYCTKNDQSINGYKLDFISMDECV